MVTGHRGLLVGVFVLGLWFPGVGRADEDKKPRGKGEKPGTIQVDLNKLPPELARQLKSYLEKGKRAMTEKPQGTARKPGELPPGLKNKPADHPGRKGYLKGQKKTQPPAKPKKEKD